MNHSLSLQDQKYHCAACGPTHVYSRGDGTMRCGSKHDEVTKIRSKTSDGCKSSALRTARYRYKNRDKCNERTRTWNADNSGRKAELYAEWYAENKQSVLDRNARRRALQRSDVAERIERLIVFKRDRAICGLCRRKILFADFEVDHIIPLSQGGLHVYDNVQASHAKCNRRKYNRIIP